MKKKVLSTVFVAVLGLMAVSEASAQWSQSSACPGWNNPANFGVGDANNYYQGQTGTKLGSQSPNVMTGYTDLNLTSQVYNKAALANVTLSNTGDCATFPSGYATNKAFAIMSGSG